MFTAMKHKSLIIDIASWAFLFLFLYTGYSKLIDHANFQKVLSVSPLIGHSLAPLVSWMIPILEIWIAVLLLAPKTKVVSIYLSLILMIVFTTYLIYMINAGGRLPCYCGGAVGHLSWHQHIWFNTGFILLALMAIFVHRQSTTVTKTKPLPSATNPNDLQPARQ
jgi:hypothetical protein